MTINVLSLFAGPGGGAEGLRKARLGETREVGIDISKAACATARAAGHIRIEADVTALDPILFAHEHFGTQDVGALIATPVCDGFSNAGKGKGREDSELLLRAIREVKAWPTETNVSVTIDALRRQMADPRSILSLEPLRWALGLRPRWVFLEQVPGVLPIWEAYAEVLAEAGYSVDTGVLSAEQYGVPQVRRRAILVARDAAMTATHGPAMLPRPTHSKFYPRTPDRIDEGVQRWVSMGEAIESWMNGEVVGFPRRYDGRGDSVTIDGIKYRGRDLRPVDQPSHTITEKARSWKRYKPEFNDQSGTPYDPDWPFKRPATVVAGRGLVQNPGATANRFNGSTKSRNDGVKVSVKEAAILQTFPADYPWQGSQTAQFVQVGDVVPPLLAAAIICEVAAGARAPLMPATTTI